MNTATDAVLLSLRPRHARSILDGTKTAEVRRARPRIAAGTVALLYATSPLRQVVGTCVVDEVVQASRSQLWAEQGARTGLSRREFLDYLAGASSPTVLLLRATRPLVRPLTLMELRDAWEGFRPPQSYRFVPAPVVRALIS